jgi:8-oxo-dGTP pyrophosphatase MutT (NUDIX family)
MSAYLGDEMPPLDYVTSARVVVLRDDSVLVMREPGDEHMHILPGGRLEEGESPEQAACREVIEETGWTLGPISLIGVTHFHHLTPMPPRWAYPYPDFLEVVFVGKAEILLDEHKLEEEIIAGLRPLRDVRAMGLPADQIIYLDAALRALQREADAGG